MQHQHPGKKQTEHQEHGRGMRATAIGGHPRSIVVPKGLQLSQFQALRNQNTAHSDAILLANMHSSAASAPKKELDQAWAGDAGHCNEGSPP